mgnify:CR=1 FL=1
MKRKITGKPRTPTRIGDITTDFTNEQLAAIGAVAMQYNETEAWIEGLFFETTRIPDAIRLEVSTRINGIEGKIEIVKHGLRQLVADDAVVAEAGSALGDGGFMGLKRHRDAVIHANVLNAPLGIGLRVDRRAARYEVLLTVPALKQLQTGLQSVSVDLMALMNLAIHARVLSEADPSDPERAQYSANLATWSARFLSRRSRTRSLPPPPQFPSESEILASHHAFFRDNREAILRWLQQYLDLIKP